MRLIGTCITLFFILNFHVSLAVANDLNKVLELTEKYIKICQTDNIDSVISSMVADGSVSTSRNQQRQVLTKIIGKWQLVVEPTWGSLPLQQQAGLKNYFLCNISASVKSGSSINFSYLENDLLPLMSKHFGTPNSLNTLPNSSVINGATWCQTEKGAMELRAVNPKQRPVSKKEEPDIINQFKIQLIVFDLRAHSMCG